MGAGQPALCWSAWRGTAGASDEAPHILEVELTRLRPNPHQPRKSFDETALLELATSIEKSGLIQPIAVIANEDGDYTIVAGERRYRAMQLLSQETIRAVVLTVGSTDELALIENIQRPTRARSGCTSSALSKNYPPLLAKNDPPRALALGQQ